MCPQYSIQIHQRRVTYGHISISLIDAFHFLKTSPWVSMSSYSPDSLLLNSFSVPLSGSFFCVTFPLMFVSLFDLHQER